MDPHLRRLRHELDDAVSGLDARQLDWHKPGKWSVAEILEHLYLTYTGTVKGCGRLLESGKPLASSLTFKNRVQSLVVVGLGYMPSGRKSPEVARPRGLSTEKIVADVQDQINVMDAILAQCATKFGSRTKVLNHPILGPFSVAQWQKFHLVHGLHHVKQIRRLRVQAGAGSGQVDLSQK